MSTSTLASPAVSEFAAAVRAALSDLTPDEVDDLTDGLEADLTDQASDGGAAEFGDPVTYAEELRAAAGLPHRRVRRPRIVGEFSTMRLAPRMIVRDVRDLIARKPWLGRLTAFLAALRPVWWVFRALLVTCIATIIIGGAPINGFNALFGIAVLIVSVQFGRGKTSSWRSRRPSRSRVGRAS